MVKSRLRPSVNYPEHKHMNAADVNFDASIYDTDILGIPLVIAVGQPEYTFLKSDNIIYYPIYVVVGEEIDSQIGVYEVDGNNVGEIMDDDGDIDVNKLGLPLLYSSFVTKDFLEKIVETLENTSSSTIDSSPESTHSTVADDDVDDDDVDDVDDVDVDDDDADDDDADDDDADDDADDDVASDTSKKSKYTPLPEQTDADGQSEALEFDNETKIGDKKHTWVQKFLHNTNYGIIDNEGGGDCLFSSIRDGLARVGIKTTVTEIRKKLADAATPSVFTEYKLIYTDATTQIGLLRGEISKLSKDYSLLKDRHAKTKDGAMLRVIAEQANEVITRHKSAQKELRNTTSNLHEFKFMKGITTLEAFRARIQTCDFWGDTWALSTLERVLNIKLVLLSSREFNDGNIDDVMVCGQLNDDILEKAGGFRPTHYIILDYVGDHYKLVTYKDRGAFTFKELPLGIKNLCVDKCMEREAGAYALIPEFRDFMKSQKKEMEPEDMTPSDLYTNDTLFRFYSRSASKPKPGKGKGERLGAEDGGSYTELAKIQDWRKMLSNFWTAPFTLDGKRWNSVEHYYQASKFKKEHPGFYAAFSLDGEKEAKALLPAFENNAKLSTDPLIAKGMGSRTGNVGGKRARPKDIKMDADFNSRKDDEMEKAMFAKFSQNPELQHMLLLTAKAKLEHIVGRGAPPIIFYDLMRVRKRLSEKSREQ